MTASIVSPSQQRSQGSLRTGGSKGDQEQPLLLGRLNLLDPLLQQCCCFIGVHGYCRLADERPCIHLVAHEMSRAAVQSGPRREGAGMGVESREERQQRGVDVDHSVPPLLDEALGH